MQEHFGDWLVRPVGWRVKLASFERSIALDSLFGPAYYHPVALSYALGDTARARHFAAAAIRLNPQSVQSRGFQAVHRLLVLRDSTSQARLLDTLPEDAAFEAYAVVERWLEPAKYAVQIGRHFLPHRESFAPYALPHALALRGHLRAALDAPEAAPPFMLYPEAASLGVLPAKRATIVFGQWLQDRPLYWNVNTLRWWSMRRDTLPILRFIRRVESSGGTSHDDSLRSDQMLTLARANLALARGDTSAALLAYEHISNARCPWWCQNDLLAAARLLSAQERFEEAERILSMPPTLEGEVPPRPSDVLWILERGRIAELLGKPKRALEAFRYVANAWREADPELDSYVAEARKAAARLAWPARP